MRSLTALAFATAVSLAPSLATPHAAAAQEAPAPVIAAQQEDQKMSDSYIGADVVARSPAGLATVGKVTDLVLDRDAKVVGVLVDIGGFLGVGAKPVGLAWSALSAQQSEGVLLLLTDLTREELEEAPSYRSLADLQVESGAAKVPAGAAVPLTQ